MPPPKDDKSLKFPAKKPAQKPAVASDDSTSETAPESAPAPVEYAPPAGLPDLEIHPVQATARRDVLEERGEQAQVQTLPVGTKLPDGLLDQPLPPPAAPSLSSTGSMKKLVPRVADDPLPGPAAPPLSSTGSMRKLGSTGSMKKLAPKAPELPPEGSETPTLIGASAASLGVPGAKVPQPKSTSSRVSRARLEAEAQREPQEDGQQEVRTAPATFVPDVPGLDKYKPEEKARRKAQIIAASALGVVVLAVLIVSLAKGDRPSVLELRETWAGTFEKRRPEPDPTEVKFDFEDDMPCPGHTIQTCLVYKLSGPKYAAKMTISRGANGWLVEALNVKH